MPTHEVLTDAELTAMGQRAAAASPGPWVPVLEMRTATGGASYIQASPDDGELDNELYLDRFVGAQRVVGPNAQLDADIDFVASARQDIPRLIAEVRWLRSMLADQQ
jgi:hypothetical protein